MFDLYLSKVRAIIGGFTCQAEIEMVRVCFSRGLTPYQASQVVINYSLSR